MKYKTTKEHFELFKKNFIYFQEKFGITQYKVYFFHTEIDNAYAEIFTDEECKVVRVSFGKEWNERKPNKNEIIENAKHECIHLLLNRIGWLGTCRYLDDAEINDELEGLVVKLTKLL